MVIRPGPTIGTPAQEILHACSQRLAPSATKRTRLFQITGWLCDTPGEAMPLGGLSIQTNSHGHVAKHRYDSDVQASLSV